MKKVITLLGTVVLSILMLSTPVLAIAPFTQRDVTGHDIWVKIHEFREKLPSLNNEQLKTVEREIANFFKGYVNMNDALALELVTEVKAKRGDPMAQIYLGKICYGAVDKASRNEIGYCVITRYDLWEKKITENEMLNEAIGWFNKVLNNPKSTLDDKMTAWKWLGDIKVFTSSYATAMQYTIQDLNDAKKCYIKMQQTARQNKDRYSYNEAAKNIERVEKKLKEISSEKMINKL